MYPALIRPVLSKGFFAAVTTCFVCDSFLLYQERNSTREIKTVLSSLLVLIIIYFVLAVPAFISMKNVCTGPVTATIEWPY